MSGKARLVAELKADPSYPSEKRRIEAFIRAGGGSRATYFNHARKLRPKADPPRIVLANSPPKAPKDALIEEALARLLQRRRGHWRNN